MTADQPVSDVCLAGRVVGVGQPAFIIAEIAQAHDGSLGLAHAYIDAVSRAGVDAVKFQTHIAAAESTHFEPWRVCFSRQDATRFDYWQRMEFSREQWRGLKQHADELGLIFFSSPFSDEAIDLLEEIDVPAWKVASGEVNNPLLLERLARSGKPVLVSSGMSPWSELDAAVDILHAAGCPCGLFQCTSTYPTAPELVGLNLLATMRQRYGVPTGISDHSGTIYPSLAAAALGVEMIEVHATLSREMFGPDVVASVTTAQLRQLVEGVRFIERAVAQPLEKDAAAQSLMSMRRTFGKSLVARCDLPAGAIVERTQLAAKKTGGGIPVDRIDQVIGRRLLRPATADQPLTEEQLCWNRAS